MHSAPGRRRAPTQQLPQAAWSLTGLSAGVPRQMTARTGGARDAVCPAGMARASALELPTKQTKQE